MSQSLLHLPRLRVRHWQQAIRHSRHRQQGDNTRGQVQNPEFQVAGEARLQLAFQEPAP